MDTLQSEVAKFIHNMSGQYGAGVVHQLLASACSMSLSDNIGVPQQHPPMYGSQHVNYTAQNQPVETVVYNTPTTLCISTSQLDKVLDKYPTVLRMLERIDRLGGKCMTPSTEEDYGNMLDTIEAINIATTQGLIARRGDRLCIHNAVRGCLQGRFEDIRTVDAMCSGEVSASHVARAYVNQVPHMSMSRVGDMYATSPTYGTAVHQYLVDNDLIDNINGVWFVTEDRKSDVTEIPKYDQAICVILENIDTATVDIYRELSKKLLKVYDGNRSKLAAFAHALNQHPDISVEVHDTCIDGDTYVICYDTGERTRDATVAYTLENTLRKLLPGN